MQGAKAAPDMVLVKFACKAPEEFVKWALVMQLSICDHYYTICWDIGVFLVQH